MGSCRTYSIPVETAALVPEFAVEDTDDDDKYIHIYTLDDSKECALA